MAIIVEDGSGLASAESYMTLVELRAYLSGRGMTTAAVSDDALCEIALRLAAQWIDTHARYKGSKLVASQALEFPRSGLLDWSSVEVSGVPKNVKSATAELAFRQLKGQSLLPDHEREAFITREQVGPISTSYAEGAPQSTVFTAPMKLLQQYVRDNGDNPMPFFGGATTGAFELGAMANPASSGLLPEA